MTRILLLLAASCALSGAEDLAGLVENRRWKRARAEVDRDLPSRKNDPRFLWLASRVRMAFNQLDEAARLGERARELNPANADYQHQLTEVYGSQAQQASLFRQIGLGRKVKKSMDATLALNPRHIQGMFVLMQYYYMAPSLIGGDKAKARAMPAEIAKVDPAEGAYAEARLAILDKQPVHVVRAAFARSVVANPRFYRGHMALADSYANVKPTDPARAAAHARAAAAIAPGRVEPYRRLAGLAAQQGRIAEMETWIAEAERVAPEDRSCRFAAAAALAAENREPGRAETYFRQFLASEPEPDSFPLWMARWRLAQLLEKTGRIADAVAELQAAARLKPDHEGIRSDLRRLKG